MRLQDATLNSSTMAGVEVCHIPVNPKTVATNIMDSNGLWIQAGFWLSSERRVLEVLLGFVG